MPGVFPWGWDPVLEIWVKIPTSCTTTRLIAAGQAYLGMCRLHWIVVNPSAPNALLAITDHNAAAGVVVVDCFLANRNTLPIAMVPAKRFETGIYLETFTNLTSVVFGYTPDV